MSFTSPSTGEHVASLPVAGAVVRVGWLPFPISPQPLVTGPCAFAKRHLSSMGKPTVPYARNIIRRALFEIVDPSPSRKEIDRVWQHFGSTCAYCECPLRKGTKQAHLDHLVSSSEGGRNHIGNRVLSCATCNEHEKRDAAWEEFLRSKAPSEAEFLHRKRRIVAWQAQFDPANLRLPDDVVAFADTCAREASDAFSVQVERLRQFRARGDRPMRT